MGLCADSQDLIWADEKTKNTTAKKKKKQRHKVIFESVAVHRAFLSDLEESGVIRMSQVDARISGWEWAFHCDTHIFNMKTCSGLAMTDSIDCSVALENSGAGNRMRIVYIQQHTNTSYITQQTWHTRLWQVLSPPVRVLYKIVPYLCKKTVFN